MSQALEEELWNARAKRVFWGAKRGLFLVEDNQGIQQAVGRGLFVVEDNKVIQQAVGRGLFLVVDNEGFV